jgi:AcrR family transcriptional regulator
VAAALACFHEVGMARTSIAQVAERAGLASGNVFYYFRSKDDLARAVVEEWCRLLAFYLTPLDALKDPWTRLEAFVDQGAELAGMYVAQGCPLAGLTRDLRQESSALTREAPRIYEVQSDWIAQQFVHAGCATPAATAHARTLMARYHGAIQLAFAQGDPTLLTDETAKLRAWLRDLRRAQQTGQ